MDVFQFTSITSRSWQCWQCWQCWQLPYMPTPRLHNHWNRHSRHLPPQQAPTNGTKMQSSDPLIRKSSSSGRISHELSIGQNPYQNEKPHWPFPFHPPQISHIFRSRTADSMASAMEDSPSTDGFCGCLRWLQGFKTSKTGMVQQFLNVFQCV